MIASTEVKSYMWNPSQDLRALWVLPGWSVLAVTRLTACALQDDWTHQSSPMLPLDTVRQRSVPLPAVTANSLNCRFKSSMFSRTNTKCVQLRVGLWYYDIYVCLTWDIKLLSASPHHHCQLSFNVHLVSVSSVSTYNCSGREAFKNNWHIYFTDYMHFLSSNHVKATKPVKQQQIVYVCAWLMELRFCIPLDTK